MACKPHMLCGALESWAAGNLRTVRVLTTELKTLRLESPAAHIRLHAQQVQREHLQLHVVSPSHRKIPDLLICRAWACQYFLADLAAHEQFA